MWHRLRGASAALVLLLTGCFGPGTLNTVDRLDDGGRGVTEVAQGVPFGTHGQKLDIWAPAARPGHPLPVVVFFYGGSWRTGDRTAYGFAGRAFARQGFVAVVPDYRKAPAVRFPAFVDDGADAVAWTVAHIASYGGDPARLGLSGHSAGAHIAALLTLDTHYLTDRGLAPETVKAAVPLSAPLNFYPFTDDDTRDTFRGADPRLTQPISFARADAPPMLLVTSRGDHTVDMHNSVDLYRRLQALGDRRVAIKDYGRVSHAGIVMALSVPFRGKAPVLADASAFLHRYLGE